MVDTSPDDAREGVLKHLGTATLYTIVSIVMFGLVYPIVLTLIAELIFPNQASGSYVTVGGKIVGSDIIGQLWTKPQYFHGRPSAAGKGYDPTSTGGTNLGPTSQKLIDATRVAIAAVRKENPRAAGPVPMDLVTSSASGIDPDISPAAAYYQSARVAAARGIDIDRVLGIIATHTHPRELGFLGEPRVNVLELNLALDEQR